MSGTPGGAATERTVVGVKLHPTGRSLEHDPGNLILRPGEWVVVEHRRTTAVAQVSVGNAQRTARGDLPRVLRRAQKADLARVEAEAKRATDALAFARERARALRLPIKVFLVELGQPGERVLFYFSAEQRVDFRELVRDLAGQMRTRVELRQVGVRDEAKMVGGIGSCGRELCCTTFLPHFAPVSIKMAKHQNLVLNPSKVSGQCGRLKCCLVYEEAQYVEAAKKLPKLGKRVETPEGMGRVDDLNILTGKIRVSFPDKPAVIFDAVDVRTVAAPDGGAAGPPPSDSDR